MYGASKDGIYTSVIVSARSKEIALKRAQKELKTKQVQFIQEIK